MSTHKFFERRQLIYLAILALGIFLLVPHFIGFERVVDLLLRAQPLLLILALAAEVSRYFVSAGSTLALARLFDRRVPLAPMTETFFAGAALNRTFSTGGAPGMFARLVFLVKHQVSAGSVAVIFLIEDLIGLIIGGIVFVVGMASLTSAQSLPSAESLIGGFVLSSLAIILLCVYVIRNRPTVERVIHGLARFADSISQRALRRQIYFADQAQRTLDDFYTGLSAARRAPGLVGISFALNIVRYIGGAATLYLSFLAFDQAIAPGILIVIYTAASVLTTTSAALGEVAILGTGLTIFFLSLGVPQDATLVALLLARAIAFWMPLFVGYFALAHLRRRHHL